MTVDFISLKLYVVKEIYSRRNRRKGARAMMIFRSRTLGSYRFTKVRFAGRYYRAQTQFRPANR